MNNYTKFNNRYDEYKKLKINDIINNSKSKFIKLGDLPLLMKPMCFFAASNKFLEFGKIKYIYNEYSDNIIQTTSCKKEINKVDLNSMIILTNNEKWSLLMSNLFKYKKKVIISNKKYENQDNMLFYMKIGNLVNNNIIWDIMIFDIDNLDNNEIKININKLISKSKYKFFIINKKNKENNLDILQNNIDLLFNNEINIPLYNEERKIITNLNNIYDIDDNLQKENFITLEEKIKIIRNKYKLNELEKKIISITKDLNILDKLELKNIKNKSNLILNQNKKKEICIICSEKKKLSCLEICGHKFCIECILKINFSGNNNLCPLCRKVISLDNLIYFDTKLNSRIILIKNILTQFKNQKSIIYSNNNDIRDYIYDFGRNNNYKIEIFDNKKTDSSNINLLIVNPNYYKKVSNIKNINNIIIIDNNYNYILHKEALGHDFANNNINIYIYEYE